jgi:hypothetical protein
VAKIRDMNFPRAVRKWRKCYDELPNQIREAVQHQEKALELAEQFVEEMQRMKEFVGSSEETDDDTDNE